MLNGICAVPIMVAMMLVASRRKIMGRFTERPPLMIFGWAATAVMAAASAVTLVSMIAAEPPAPYRCTVRYGRHAQVLFNWFAAKTSTAAGPAG